MQLHNKWYINLFVITKYMDKTKIPVHNIYIACKLECKEADNSIQ